MTGRRSLVIDTAGPVIGVAAFVGSTCVWSAEQRIVLGADGWLLPALAEGLARIGGLRTDDCVVVGVGPGAFTGVRVGLSAALGLAEAVGCGVIPVSSLELRAAATPGEARLIVALDARKGRVYVSKYDTTGLQPVCFSDAKDIPPAEAFTGEGAATGEGACVYREALGWLTLVERADTCGVHAAGCFVSGACVDPAAVQLAYLRGEDQVVTLPKAARAPA